MTIVKNNSNNNNIYLVYTSFEKLLLFLKKLLNKNYLYDKAKAREVYLSYISEKSTLNVLHTIGLKVIIIICRLFYFIRYHSFSATLNEL